LGPKVAILEFDENRSRSYDQCLRLVGGIGDINSLEKEIVVKVGVFSHKADNHTSVDLVGDIIESFDRSPRIFVAESDNCKGTALERLQIWRTLFTGRVIPFSLSDDDDTRSVKLAGEEMKLSHVLFEPNIVLSTHILRTFESGSILKNLFGCIPTSKKMKYHKVLPQLLADVYEAIGGIDLAVLDGTHLWHGAGGAPIRMNTLLVGRDAVAVETVGAILSGLNPEKMPVIQEFAKRGLGEGNFKNIEIVGASFDNLKEKFTYALKTAKSHHHKTSPQTWGGRANREMKSLVQEGFFKLPDKRTTRDVARALEVRNVETEGRESSIAGILSRRVEKGVLKTCKGPDGQLYWTE
jgi:uncharacterized protein (DUF362 family)